MLILVALADRLAEIVVDEKIHTRVGHEAWRAVSAEVVAGASDGRLADGISSGIAEAGCVLATHFPPRPDDTNELPDYLVVV